MRGTSHVSLFFNDLDLVWNSLGNIVFVYRKSPKELFREKKKTLFSSFSQNAVLGFFRARKSKSAF